MAVGEVAGEGTHRVKGEEAPRRAPAAPRRPPQSSARHGCPTLPAPGLLRFVGQRRGAPGLGRCCHGRRRLLCDGQEAADGGAIHQLPWGSGVLVLIRVCAGSAVAAGCERE